MPQVNGLRCEGVSRSRRGRQGSPFCSSLTSNDGGLYAAVKNATQGPSGRGADAMALRRHGAVQGADLAMALENEDRQERTEATKEGVSSWGSLV